MTEQAPFKYFKTSPEIIRLAVMLYVRFPLSLRNVEDLLHERGIEVTDGALPLDKWMGTWHDGTPEAHAQMMTRFRRKGAGKTYVSIGVQN